MCSKGQHVVSSLSLLHFLSSAAGRKAALHCLPKGHVWKVRRVAICEPWISVWNRCYCYCCAHSMHTAEGYASQWSHSTHFLPLQAPSSPPHGLRIKGSIAGSEFDACCGIWIFQQRLWLEYKDARAGERLCQQACKLGSSHHEGKHQPPPLIGLPIIFLAAETLSPLALCSSAQPVASAWIPSSAGAWVTLLMIHCIHHLDSPILPLRSRGNCSKLKDLSNTRIKARCRPHYQGF